MSSSLPQGRTQRQHERNENVTQRTSGPRGDMAFFPSVFFSILVTQGKKGTLSARMDEVTEATCYSINSDNKMGRVSPRSDMFGEGELSQLPRTGVAEVELGKTAMTYKTTMKGIFGETGTTRVYHGTSAEAAEGIVTAGFGMSYDYSSAGVFVKKDKSAVHYAMEHASTPKGGAVVEAVLFLKGGSFTHRGGTIIVHDPNLLVPVRVHYLASHDMSDEEMPVPPMIRRGR